MVRKSRRNCVVAHYAGTMLTKSEIKIPKKKKTPNAHTVIKVNTNNTLYLCGLGIHFQLIVYNFYTKITLAQCIFN